MEIPEKNSNEKFEINWKTEYETDIDEEQRFFNLSVDDNLTEESLAASVGHPIDPSVYDFYLNKFGPEAMSGWNRGFSSLNNNHSNNRRITNENLSFIDYEYHTSDFYEFDSIGKDNIDDYNISNEVWKPNINFIILTSLSFFNIFILFCLFIIKSNFFRKKKDL